jgi:hypothetical protein
MTSKKIGICMDHSHAHLMEFTIDTIETKTVNSKFTHDEKMNLLSKSEHSMHEQEQQEQLKYYKELGSVIRNYTEVILFGPTEAHAELLNILRADHLFEKIKINVQKTDKMTENQEHAFVKKYFSKH